MAYQKVHHRRRQHSSVQNDIENIRSRTPILRKTRSEIYQDRYGTLCALVSDGKISVAKFAAEKKKLKDWRRMPTVVESTIRRKGTHLQRLTLEEESKARSKMQTWLFR